MDESPNSQTSPDVAFNEPAPVHAPLPPAVPFQPTRQPAQSPAAARPRHHWWIWVVILVVIGLGVYWWMTRPNTATQTTATGRGGRGGGGPVPVVVARSKTGDMPVYLTEQGNVIPLNTVTVRSRVDGQIDKVAFTEGQLVKEGDLLVQIDPRPFEVQLLEAQGQLAKDQATLNNAILDLQRFKSAGTAIPEQQVQTQEATVRVDQAALKVDQAAIQSANLNITYSKITAPITGIIGLRNVDVGNIIHAADTNGIAIINQVQPITVIFTLPQFDIPQVLKRMAQTPPPPVDAFNVYDTGMSAKLATGTLTAIDSQVDPTSGTVRLKATFQNKDNKLFPNQFVNARLTVDTLKSVVLVPDDAIQLGPDGDFVYVVQPDQTVKVQAVKVGQSEDKQTVVTSGLQAGETVVTEGVDKLQDGSEVSLRSGATTRGASTRNATTTQSHRHGS